MPTPRKLATALLFAAVTLSRSAGADDDKASAKALFDRGVEQMEAKNYTAACPALERSQKLDPHPGTLFALAECEAQRGRAAAAFARYGEYLNVYASLTPDKQRKQGTRDKEARAQRAQLEQVVAEVTFTLPSDAPAGTVVTRDGKTLGDDDLHAPTLLDPGEHTVTTQAPDGPVTEQRFTLAKGEKRTITIEVRSSASVASPSAAPRPSVRRVATFVIGGVGAAGLVLGTITGGLMLSKRGAIKAGCKDGGGAVEACDAAGASAGNSAKTLGAVASAGFVAGLAAAGVAVVLFATEPRAPKAARGGFIEVEASSSGPLGTTVGVRGSF